MTQVDDNPNSDLDKNNKRALPSDEGETSEPVKKTRLVFHAREFRQKLNTTERAKAIQNFIDVLNEKTKHDNILSYLDAGGNILEILQSMENDQTLSPVLVFELVNKILLQIQAKFTQFQSIAYDACRYLLNTHIILINKMFSPSSSLKERLVTLKLLTTIVTASAILAKDILLHVNFKPNILDMLSKAGEGKMEVRNAFVFFIAAFIVDGHFPTISVLLEKKGLLTSIIYGLKFDRVETVVLILTAIKNHIVENPQISKTTKMKTFNTKVLKDIVNLYNWKGPGGIYKKSQKVVQVDEMEKSKVSEAVHALLLVLCTSHKFGVIFRDPTLGLNKKHQNTLMLTVMECLERPWEHSYAGELVSKICGACPDLTKTMWTNLKTFIEPRDAAKWLNAMRFAEKLIEQNHSNALAMFVKDLNVQQVVQIIINLSAPLSIIKIVLSEGHEIERQHVIKAHILKLFVKMANAIQCYLEQSKSWPNIDEKFIYSALSNHIQNSFPDSKFILSKWDEDDKAVDEKTTECGVEGTLEYLNVAFELLGKYKLLAPSMLDAIGPVYDIREFLAKTDNLQGKADNLALKQFQVKVAKFFLELEPSFFTIKSDLYPLAMRFSMEYYYETQDVIALDFLTQLLKSTSFFDNCPLELSIWIDGILNASKFDPITIYLLIDLIRAIDASPAKFYKLIDQLGGNDDEANFSLMLVALIEYGQANKITNKTIKTYLNFVLINLLFLQHDQKTFCKMLLPFNGYSIDLRIFFEALHNDDIILSIPKCKGRILGELTAFASDFIEKEIDTINFGVYPNARLHLSQAAMFYFTNLIRIGSIEERHNANIMTVVKILNNEGVLENEIYLRMFLQHPVIFKRFTIFSSENDSSSKFIQSFIEQIANVTQQQHKTIDKFLASYRLRIMSQLEKVFRKPQKYANKQLALKLIEVVNLTYGQCVAIIENFIRSVDNCPFFPVIAYCLNRMAALALKDYSFPPLENEAVENLSNIFVHLINQQQQLVGLNNFSQALLNYLKTFPHNLAGVTLELFEKLLLLPDYTKEHVLLCEFVFDRNYAMVNNCFSQHLNDVCSKKSMIFNLLNVVITHCDDTTLKRVFDLIEPHITKAMQKPHKAGQHLQNNYKSIGILIDKFMSVESYAKQIMKFDTVELFHVYLLERIFSKIGDDKKLSNIIMTFVHLLNSALKQVVRNDEDKMKMKALCEIVFDYMNNKIDKTKKLQLNTNETLKSFVKLSLKHGIGNDSHANLLNILIKLIEFQCFANELNIVLDMMLSHSQFLDVVLADSPNKLEVINLWLVLCGQQPGLMEKNHVPVLLAAYKATQKEQDKRTLNLLQMYEAKPEQTEFFSFKPFLWGRSAASYYSVRQDIQKVLWRQPKMGDILDNLQDSLILHTITNPNGAESYDLNFFLPLFCHLLSLENPVFTYRFTKSGALALTLSGLRGDKKQRLAACQILSRFHYHLEARRTGKDTILWLRFIEAVSIGLVKSNVDELKLNNFATIYLALSALVLTQPNHVMYLPLTQYLVAKNTLDFSTIPELYTFLHSCDVNSRDHRLFILDVIKHGLIDEKDFACMMKSMTFKFISELCSSSLVDGEMKSTILDVFYRCCCIESIGVKVLCGSLSFLSQITTLLHLELKHKNINNNVMKKLLDIMHAIINSQVDKNRYFVIFLNLMSMIECDNFNKCSNENMEIVYEILCKIMAKFDDFLQRDHFELISRKTTTNPFCTYIRQYGKAYLKLTDCSTSVERLFFIKKN